MKIHINYLDLLSIITFWRVTCYKDRSLMPHIQRNSFCVYFVESRGSEERRREEGWKTICVKTALQAWMSQGVKMTSGRMEGSCSVARTMTFVSLLIHRGRQGLLLPEHLQSTQQNTVISDARTSGSQSLGCWTSVKRGWWWKASRWRVLQWEHELEKSQAVSCSVRQWVCLLPSLCSIHCCTSFSWLTWRN